MNVPKMAAGLGIGLVLGIGALSTSVAAQSGHTAPVGCASHPGSVKGHDYEPVGCESRPGNGYGDKHHHHSGPARPTATTPPVKHDDKTSEEVTTTATVEPLTADEPGDDARPAVVASPTNPHWTSPGTPRPSDAGRHGDRPSEGHGSSHGSGGPKD